MYAALTAVFSLSLAHAGDPMLRVETWNVGLAHGFVDDAADRRGHILEALESSSADVVCLQEVWDAADRRLALDVLESSYPYSYASKVKQHKASSAPACKTDDLFGDGKFVSCLMNDCSGTSGDAQTACIIEKCQPPLDALKTAKPECANALMAQVGKSTPVALWNIIRPVRKAGLFAYGGSDGLVLTSRLPLDNLREVDFTDIATLNRRRAIVADVTVDGTAVTVACTHLTADLSELAPYPGTFPSWGDENAAQVDRLIEAVGDGPAVLMGDFNCGWADEETGLAAELPSSCEKFQAAGYASTALELGPACTWCDTNTINQTGDDEHYESLIDHVFVRGVDPVEGGVCHDETVDLGKKRSSLSDHYGYRASLFVPVP